MKYFTCGALHKYNEMEVVTMEPIEFDKSGNAILPQPDRIPEKDKEHAAGAYIMMFASQYLPLPLINMLAAFIYHMFCRKRDRFVAFHTYQSFISQIPTSVFLWGLIGWTIWNLVMAYPDNYGLFFNWFYWTACGLILLWNLVYTILSIIAYRRAGKGRLFYLPVFGTIAFNRYFGPNAIDISSSSVSTPPNRPPSGHH